jgi:hypothetical protein
MAMIIRGTAHAVPLTVWAKFPLEVRMFKRLEKYKMGSIKKVVNGKKLLSITCFDSQYNLKY